MWKAVMLASLRSLIPKVWGVEHEARGRLHEALLTSWELSPPHIIWSHTHDIHLCEHDCFLFSIGASCILLVSTVNTTGRLDLVLGQLGAHVEDPAWSAQRPGIRGLYHFVSLWWAACETPGFNWIKFHSGKTEESPCQDSSALWTGSSGTYRRRASPDCAGMYTGASLNKLQPGRTILSSRPHDCTSSQARRESSGVLWFVVLRPVGPVGSPLHPTTAILTLPSCLPVTSHVVTSLHSSVSLVQFFFWRRQCFNRFRMI